MGGAKAEKTCHTVIVKVQEDSLVLLLKRAHKLYRHTAKKMAVLLGSYSIPLLGVSIFIATLTYITYKLLSDYLQKWFEMKPIPEVKGTYLFIGCALQFKNNAGGKKAINMLLQEAA